MCVFMLLMNVIFILMVEILRLDGMVFCIVIVILLYYFLLMLLMWMCIEVVNMYQVLIKVFIIYLFYFILKRCFVVWGEV